MAVALWGALLLLGAGSPASAHEGIDQQIAHLDTAIAENPSDATLRVRRGELHRIHRDWERADEDFRAALQLDPQLLTAEMCLGRLRLEMGRPAEAKTYLDHYLEQRPQDAQGRVTRARALVELGEHLAAAEDYTVAIASSPRGPRPEYYLERARALQSAGPDHLEEAIRGLDEGLVALGNPVTLELFAVELELARQNADAALRRIDEMARESVRQEPWLIRRGAILESAGRTEEARDAYRRALEAIEATPSARRSTKAVADLEREARAALERLDAATPTQ